MSKIHVHTDPKKMVLKGVSVLCSAVTVWEISQVAGWEIPNKMEVLTWKYGKITYIWRFIAGNNDTNDDTWWHDETYIYIYVSQSHYEWIQMRKVLGVFGANQFWPIPFGDNWSDQITQPICIMFDFWEKHGVCTRICTSDPRVVAIKTVFGSSCDMVVGQQMMYTYTSHKVHGVLILQAT